VSKRQPRERSDLVQTPSATRLAESARSTRGVSPSDVAPRTRPFLAMAAGFLPQFWTPVMEIGAFDVTDSARDLFSGCDSNSVDVGPGPGPGVVCSGDGHDADGAQFDLADCFYQACPSHMYRSVVQSLQDGTTSFRPMSPYSAAGSLVTSNVQYQPGNDLFRSWPDALPQTQRFVAHKFGSSARLEMAC